ncbi:cytochrome c3 family protein [Neorhodopirellula pilleata]|uniref:Doubled CXXCH motif domain-containing protein n=1 Tax=Neorhodopirellula pilleata TaxID=2714738 RepID=A0A5C6A4G8_9BACT|nr:cytochrome c3 family protein [Neorhodopirellula pilleata]TWT94336.1 hypothetical protein Pla100_39470 [Neorhodopirellula pilleata]
MSTRHVALMASVLIGPVVASQALAQRGSIVISRDGPAEGSVVISDDLLEENHYIGSAQCVACHQDQFLGYRDTLHNQTARQTDVALEPKPGNFVHHPSQNRYEVKISGNRMVHCEQRLSTDGNLIGETAFPMDVTLGSGTNSTSYLTKIGSFHIESPITHFSDDETWYMSPGYESRSHLSFRRAVTVGCVFCHVGSIQQINHNPYKFEIREQTIGCERCHGPGKVHAERHRSNDLKIADTIVNPRSLNRELSEAICQQCHCQGAVELPVAGRDTWDFRPGQRLTDYRVDFQFRSEGSDAMSLVGHVEQLHSSKCYTQSDTLTCITCHDPHQTPTKENRLEFNRSQCLQCHQDESCVVPQISRIDANANDCVTCHMPRRDTTVAHFALHNHRIGIHSDSSTPMAADSTEVEPILDIGDLPLAEQKRLRALVKYELFRRRGGDPRFATLLPLATAELIQVKQNGAADAEVDAALVWLAWEQGQAQIAESLAHEILANEPTETNPRIVATHTLARMQLNRGQFAQAIERYHELESMHRDSSHSYFRGLAEQNHGSSDKAIEALKRSLEIDPSQIAAHRALEAIYQSTNQNSLAEKHNQAAMQNQLRMNSSVDAKRGD